MSLPLFTFSSFISFSGSTVRISEFKCSASFTGRRESTRRRRIDVPPVLKLFKKKKIYTISLLTKPMKRANGWMSDRRRARDVLGMNDDENESDGGVSLRKSTVQASVSFDVRFPHFFRYFEK